MEALQQNELSEIVGGWLPSTTQTWLLKAALMPGAGALDAWQQWKSSTNFEHEEFAGGAFRLLPLVYCNLQRQSFADELMPRLKGIYRQNWYKNRVRFHQMGQLVQHLTEEQIPTLLLKGAALLLRHYQDYGARVMRDFDLLVPPDRTLKAVELLRKLGWIPLHTSYERFKPSLLATRHACSFVHAGTGGEFDLHWHTLFQLPRDDDHASFWQGAQPIEFAGVSSLTLNPADQLLHLLAHGVRWGKPAPVYWVADACTVLQTTPDLDWQRFVKQAENYRLTLLVREALGYLIHNFGVGVPLHVGQQLQTSPISTFEQQEFALLTSPPSWLGELPFLWFRYRRLFPEDLIWLRPLYFTRYVQRSFDFDHYWQIFPMIGQKGSRRLWEKLKTMIPTRSAKN